MNKTNQDLQCEAFFALLRADDKLSVAQFAAIAQAASNWATASFNEGMDIGSDIIKKSRPLYSETLTDTPTIDRLNAEMEAEEKANPLVRELTARERLESGDFSGDNLFNAIAEITKPK